MNANPLLAEALTAVGREQRTQPDTNTVQFPDVLVRTAGLPDNKRIASRSMRATGATLAHHGGASIEDICSLTDHHSPEIAATYIRSRDPKNQHITLTEQPFSST